jgi:hypothetical protein
MDGAIKEGDPPQMGLARRRWLERIGRRGSAVERRIWMGERNAWGKRMDGVMNIEGGVSIPSLKPEHLEFQEDSGLILVIMRVPTNGADVVKMAYEAFAWSGRGKRQLG